MKISPESDYEANVIEEAAPRKPVDRFAYAEPTQRDLASIGVIRAAYRRLYHELRETCPGSRERSLAITALEESSMWAVKSILFGGVDLE